MPRIRQLPEIFLRGSLVNETIKNLTPVQRQQVDDATNDIVANPRLAGHVQEFKFQLGATIACDYRDESIANQEFQIAVWRGVAYILYHCDYEFKCNHCGSTSYRTELGKTAKFDRRYPICPVCRHCMIKEPGDSGLEVGTCISHDHYEDLILNLSAAQKAVPNIVSCVSAIRGQPKCPNPHDILNDNDQIYKFFGTWVWNHFRQILLENHIPKHDKVTKKMVGPADCMTMQAIVSVLRDAGGSCTYYDGDNPVGGSYYAVCSTLAMPSKVLTAKVLKLLDTIDPCRHREITSERDGETIHLLDLGMSIRFKRDEVHVSNLYGHAPCIEVDVSVSEEVKVACNTVGGYDDDDSADTIKQLEQPDMCPEQNTLDQLDSLQTLRSALPDDTKVLFDILTTGAVETEENAGTYKRFAEQFPQSQGNGGPKQSQMATFLNVTTKEIKRMMEVIRTYMLALGMAK